MTIEIEKEYLSLSAFLSSAQLTIRPNQMELCNRYFFFFYKWTGGHKERWINHMYNTLLFFIIIKYRVKLYFRTLSKQKNQIYISMRHSGTNSTH
jgi:hypothetical protein